MLEVTVHKGTVFRTSIPRNHIAKAASVRFLADNPIGSVSAVGRNQTVGTRTTRPHVLRQSKATAGGKKLERVMGIEPTLGPA
jgi:hypothetical protein